MTATSQDTATRNTATRDTTIRDATTRDATTRDNGRSKARAKATTMKPKKTIKRRNAPAASLADPRYRARIVKSAKVYSRKSKPKDGDA